MKQVSFKPIIIVEFNTGNDEKILKDNNIDFKKVEGCYKGVTNDAFVVAYRHLPTILDLAEEYNQESIMVSGNDRVSHLLFIKTGNIVNIGTLQRVSSIEGLDAYTIDAGQVWTCK